MKRKKDSPLCLKDTIKKRFCNIKEDLLFIFFHSQISLVFDVAV